MKKSSRQQKAILASEKSDLRQAGYSATDLLQAGYSATDLRQAGYSLTDLLQAGYSATDLLQAGYSATDLRQAGYSLTDLLQAGYSATDLRQAGYSATDLLQAGYSATDLLQAGYSATDLLQAGYSATDLRQAGYSATDLKELEAIIEKIPMIKKPYGALLSDIQNKIRCHKQSTFGPDDFDETKNVCGTEMCTAGHIVNMGGAAGYELKKYTGSYAVAASIIHGKWHPEAPRQNFGSIGQELALAYIEEMAEYEKTGVRFWLPNT